MCRIDNCIPPVLRASAQYRVQGPRGSAPPRRQGGGSIQHDPGNEEPVPAVGGRQSPPLGPAIVRHLAIPNASLGPQRRARSPSPVGYALVVLAEHRRDGGCEGDLVMSTKLNHWLQAARGCALLFFLAHWPRVPEPKRYANSHL